MLTAILICSRFRPQGLHPGKVCLLQNQVGGEEQTSFSLILVIYVNMGCDFDKGVGSFPLETSNIHLSLARGGPDRDPGPRYQPFRLTPYVTKIRVSDGAPAQPCCLLIAERIHSGYEGG